MYTLRVCDVDECQEQEKKCQWPIEELSINSVANSGGVSLTLTFFAPKPGDVAGARAYTLSMLRRERDTETNVRFRQLGKLHVVGRDYSTRLGLARRREHPPPTPEVTKQYNLLGRRVRVSNMTVADLLTKYIAEKMLHIFIFYEGPRGRSTRDVSWALNTVRWLEQKGNIPHNTNREVFRCLQSRMGVQGDIWTYEKEGHCPKYLEEAMRQMKSGHIIRKFVRKPDEPTTLIPNPNFVEFEEKPPPRAVSPTPTASGNHNKIMRVYSKEFPCPPGTGVSELESNASIRSEKALAKKELHTRPAKAESALLVPGDLFSPSDEPNTDSVRLVPFTKRHPVGNPVDERPLSLPGSFTPELSTNDSEPLLSPGTRQT